jgi:hypothetical protein
MKDFVTVKTEGMTTVFFEPTLSELNDLGYDNVYDLSEDFNATVDDNYPGLVRFAEFDTNSRFIAINCDTEEIAETINEELNYLIEYRTTMIADAAEEDERDEIKLRIQILQDEINELKKLLL